MGELLEQGHAHVRVLNGLHAVADPGDADVPLLHVTHELVRSQTPVEGLGEVFGRAVDGSAEPRPDGQQPGHQRRDQVLARPGRHDGVVGAGHARTMVRRELQDDLDELGRPGG